MNDLRGLVPNQLTDILIALDNALDQAAVPFGVGGARTVLAHMSITTCTPPQNPAPKLLLSRKEAAYTLSVSLRSVDYLIAEGRLKTRKIRGRILIPYDELVRFVRLDRMDPMVPSANVT